MDQVVAENGVQNVQLLSAINDNHGGVVVEMEGHMDSNVFLPMLRASISQWKLQGKKGVWIKLPIGLVNLVETAVKEGFRYHHAEPHYLMLVYWIPETVNTLPANATHRVGIGAIVLNNKRELLVVQEKSGIFKGSGVWKIPTGVVDEGEDIFVAATREVKEETGIDTEFVEILAFRNLIIFVDTWTGQVKTSENLDIPSSTINAAVGQFYILAIPQGILWEVGLILRVHDAPTIL